MPILPLERFLFPDDLLTNPAWSPNGSRRWWVLHTRPRAEKALARRLGTLGSAFFLPLYERRLPCRRRVLRAYLPLFPGYVFLMGDEPSRGQALETNLVTVCLVVGNQFQLQADLAKLHRAMTMGVSLAPEARIRPGMFVEITRGPLAGFQGKVIRRDDRLRFVLEVDFLQKGASMEIDGSMIERL